MAAPLRLRLGLFGAVALTVMAGLLAPATFAHHRDPPAGSPGADSPTTFFRLERAFDVDVTSRRVLATQCGNGIREYPPTVHSIDDAGIPAPFATIPGALWCLTVAVSPGLGGFEKDAVYVAAGPRIWIIPPEGCAQARTEMCPEELALSGDMVDEIGGQNISVWLTFDSTGGFGHRLLAVSTAFVKGGVWAIDVNGHTERIPPHEADWYPGPSGQPAVAPASFGNYGGYLMIPRWADDVLFMSPAGGAEHIIPFGNPDNNIDQPTSVSFVPPESCELGASQGLFFQGMRTGSPHEEGVRKFRGSDFGGKSGSALIGFEGNVSTGDYEGMLFLSPDAAGDPALSVFHRDPEDSPRFSSGDFSDCPDPWSATVPDVKVDEGDPGSVNRVVFRVRLASPPTQPVTVHYETRAGSAQEGSDYLPVRGEVTFGEIVPGVSAPAGINAPVTSTTADIEVEVVGDDATERNEQFFLELIDPGRPQVLAAQGVATIVDDDRPAPVISPPPQPDADPIPQQPPAEGGGRPPAPTLETEALAPAVTPVQTTAAAAGPQLPPPAPPGGAPAPSAGPAAGPAPWPGPVGGESSAAVTSPVAVPVLAPAPAPQIVPGFAGMKEEQVQAAPESDYAMVAHAGHRQGTSAGPGAWVAILLVVSGCGVAGATAKRRSDEEAEPQPSFCFVR